MVGFLGRSWWPFDLASHFRVQYLVVLLVALLAAIVQRQRLAVVLAGCTLLNASLILPFYVGGDGRPSDDVTYRALLFNVSDGSSGYIGFRDLIEQLDPDFMVLVEVTPAWEAELRYLSEEYRYYKHFLSETWGIALLSRIPFMRADTRGVGNPPARSIIATLRLAGQELVVIGTHLHVPLGSHGSRSRNRQLQSLGELVASQNAPTMVLGDLNTTMWSPFFGAFLRDTTLRNGRTGFGIQASWPAGLAPLWVPIDHILVSSRITVHELRTGPSLRSDHYPVLLDFGLTGSAP